MQTIMENYANYYFTEYILIIIIIRYYTTCIYYRQNKYTNLNIFIFFQIFGKNT